ncbi:uncharacterized protein LOC107766495 isoform X4 [Nicotiana tabacum]|uniref:Uncharacterized protein LOC107766495 isoform X4 n=2 Tax=Nicotiana TaxID=4085 RepID=A0A1S3XLH0_TOBAC|nr:PREDICTED: uncharacterized protein LOC104226916 isoform X2 [Nicotiana sylvestris]XP_016440781.1 PREDICTED: uncharacterized protein LOC107766495 isoform X2 [Nicotiana tabacum]
MRMHLQILLLLFHGISSGFTLLHHLFRRPSAISDTYRLLSAGFCFVNISIFTEMPADKTTIASTSCSSKKKRQYSTEIISKMKLRRRELYKQLSFDKKESLLSQRRSKEFESKSQCLLLDSTKEGSSFKAKVDLHWKRTLTIRGPCSFTETADISLTAEAAAGPTGGSSKGKNLTDHFSVFELGSTFAATHEGHDTQILAIPNKVAEAAAGSTGGSGKGKNLTDHFFVFELGSTCGAPHERHDPQALAIPNKDSS